ncbi:hypothetical protein PIB30_065778 [Stylosanthes scabra]|uniref:Uncharacterized protein n=1 Tax=Stylosanthes scabra TaxID=79078 RepID=A0ABU6VKP1_9FABA|nr:hypothetical protein [Stylosanthes scabra]
MGLIYGGQSHKWNIKFDYPCIQAMPSHYAVLMEDKERTFVFEVSLLLSARSYFCCLPVFPLELWLCRIWQIQLLYF